MKISLLFLSAIFSLVGCSNREFVEKKLSNEELKILHVDSSREMMIADCFEKEKMAGKEIVLKAHVVKYNAGILGKNWLHVQDDKSPQGKNDLVVTTLNKVKVGDNVKVIGKMSYDKDLGSGYFFPAIMEDAQVEILSK